MRARQEPASEEESYARRRQKRIRFKVLVDLNGSDMELADGGFVDWSQKLLGSKKEWALVSGLGDERLCIDPDIPVAFDSVAYFGLRDVAMEKILQALPV